MKTPENKSKNFFKQKAKGLAYALLPDLPAMERDFRELKHKHKQLVQEHAKVSYERDNLLSKVDSPNSELHEAKIQIEKLVDLQKAERITFSKKLEMVSNKRDKLLAKISALNAELGQFKRQDDKNHDRISALQEPQSLLDRNRPFLIAHRNLRDIPFAYIHIGIKKTGTTALQHFFRRNEEALCRNGIYFPLLPGGNAQIKLTIYSGDPDNGITNLRRRARLLDNEAFNNFMAEFQARLIEEVSPYVQAGSSVLLSDEHLSGNLKYPGEIERLKSLVVSLGLVPKIIIYLRRQDLMQVSGYSTMLRSDVVDDFSLDIDRYVFNYGNIIDLWASVFGKEAIIVRPFEKTQFYGGDIFSDFMHVVGIDDLSDFVKLETRLNRSLDRHQLRFLSVFNSELKNIAGDEINALRGDIGELLEQFASGKSIKLSRNTCEHILAKYVEQNAHVAREYLGREDGRLFLEPLPDEENDELPELDLPTAINIFTRLWAAKQKQIIDLKKSIDI